MDHSHLIVVVKVLRAYIHLLIVLANFGNWLINYEQRHHKRRKLTQRTSTRFQIRSIEVQGITHESEAGAETEEFTVPLSTPSNAASTSSISQGEASSRKRKRKVNVAKDVIKMIEKGLHSVSEEMSKLVSIVGTPGLQSMPNELREMGFDIDKCVAISMYFADHPAQLHLWNGMNAAFKPSFVEIVLKKLSM